MQKSFAHILILCTLGTTCHAVEPASTERLEIVAERGAKVMPFSLDKTVHIFDKTPIGGVQQVLVKTASDSEQIAMIRKHLANIAERFAAGDFSGPQSIHGKDMPGTQALGASAQRVHFVYQDLPNGGQIEFVTTEPELIDAIHRYFDAQLSDHARHAKSGSHKQHSISVTDF